VFLLIALLGRIKQFPNVQEHFESLDEIDALYTSEGAST
jgi:hypothetical protein